MTDLLDERQAPPTENPLPPCPDTPNCVRTSRTVPVDADALFRAAQTAAESLRPATLRVFPADRRLDAAYRVAFLFTDDVDVLVRPHDEGSTIYVRSASRVGAWDLGVNRRRVDRFFSALERALTDGAAENRATDKAPSQ